MDAFESKSAQTRAPVCVRNACRARDHTHTHTHKHTRKYVHVHANRFTDLPALHKCTHAHMQSLRSHTLHTQACTCACKQVLGPACAVHMHTCRAWDITHTMHCKHAHVHAHRRTGLPARRTCTHAEPEITHITHTSMHMRMRMLTAARAACAVRMHTCRAWDITHTIHC